MADDSLLDRLNALKPMTISIKQSTLSVTDKPPTSREDGLASRLKTLRIAREAEASDDVNKSPAEPHDLPRGSAESAPQDTDDDLFADDDAVNDLLMEIAAQQGFGDEDAAAAEHSDDLLPLPDVPSSDWLNEDGDGQDTDDSHSEEHSRQVEALLQKLASTPLKGAHIPDKDDDSDDSDGERMDDEIRRVLDRAKDEAAWDDTGDDAPDDAPRPITQPGDDALGLPSVPTSFADSSAADDGHGNTLGLPSAPTQDLPARGTDDDISRRLAGLRGLRGKAAGLGETDAFGLPSAPTFRPGDEGGVLKRGHFGFGRANYTDADQQTWCIVCLEDATVRCVGCAEDGGGARGTGANNAYCDGCWRDMHVGPAAGFDERGHMRVPLKKTPWPY